MVGKSEGTLAKASDAAHDVLVDAGDAVKAAPSPSPNPMTNLIIADVLLRGGGQFMRHAVERTLLGVKYPKDKAKNIVKGRSMAQTILTTAAARLATRSVPGALLVGGALIAKTLFDYRRGESARKEGQQAVERQVKRANDKP